jgi:hypothetical protein
MSRRQPDDDLLEKLIVRVAMVQVIVPLAAYKCDVKMEGAAWTMVICASIFAMYSAMLFLIRFWAPSFLVRLYESFPGPIEPDENGIITYFGKWIAVLYIRCIIEGSRKYILSLIGLLTVAWRCETGAEFVFIGTVAGLYIGVFDWDLLSANLSTLDVVINTISWMCIGIMGGCLYAYMQTGILRKRWYWYTLWILTPWTTAIVLMSSRWLFGRLFVACVCSLHLTLLVCIAM